MSARDELLREMTHNHLYMDDDRAAELIDAFAHELAEQIRADIIPELDEYGTREQQAEIDGRRGAADLIDPHISAGPVRPREENTP